MSDVLEFAGEEENGTVVTIPEETPEEEKVVVPEKEGDEVPEKEEVTEEEKPVVAEKPVMVKLSDGTEVSVEELSAGYMKGKDYTQKTMELADLRRMALQVKPVEAPAPVVPEEDVLKDVPPEETARLSKVLKAMGYVKRDDLAMERQQETVTSVDKAFFIAHPEYTPAQDVGDTKYKALLAELSDYNLTDTTKRAAILEKAHKQVVTQFHGAGKSMTAPKIVTSAATGAKSSQSSSVKETGNYSDVAIANAKRFGLLDD